MEKEIYLKTINNGVHLDYYSKKQLRTLETILKAGAIYSRRMAGKAEGINFAGLDYISLTDYEKKDVFPENVEGYSGFYSYVMRGISFAFPKDKVEVITPTIISPISQDVEGYNLMKVLGLCEDERFSDLPDEVQAKDSIDLDLMCGMTFPVESFICSNFFRRKEKKVELLKEEIRRVKQLIELYGYDTKIYDAETFTELNDDSARELILNR